MATKKAMDAYANYAAVMVTESAPSTLTTAKFAFPFSIMDKMALLISRIEYWIGDMGVLNSSGDSLVIGLAAASTLVVANNQADPTIIDSMSYNRFDIGTAASGLFFSNPFVKDFSDLPGGGLLVAPNPLYAFIKAGGTSTAANAWVKLFYTYMTLADADYWQLVESRRIISS